MCRTLVVSLLRVTAYTQAGTTKTAYVKYSVSVTTVREHTLDQSKMPNIAPGMHCVLISSLKVLDKLYCTSKGLLQLFELISNSKNLSKEVYSKTKFPLYLCLRLKLSLEMQPSVGGQRTVKADDEGRQPPFCLRVVVVKK